MHRCRKHHGISRLPDVEGDQPARKKFNTHPIGFFNIDIAEVSQATLDQASQYKPIERLNGEIKRRTEVVDIFPNDGPIVRLAGVLLLEQNGEWAVQRSGYTTLETITTMSDNPLTSLPAAS